VILHGDCIEQMRELDEASVDAICTDPPYGLEFMGKEWDRLGATSEAVDDTDWDGRTDSFPFGGGGRRIRYGASAKSMQEWHQAWATEALRILKPGGHLLAFGGTRTYHRLACAVEDAGFEIRDSLIWIYGSGFPKSLDVSKAIDKASPCPKCDGVGGFEAGGPEDYHGEPCDKCGGTGRAEGTYGDPKSEAHAGWIDRGRMRGEEGHEGYQRPWMEDEQAVAKNARKYEPATPEAQQWQGWGTALKPAHEPIVVARKPLSGTVAANVLEHGTGALNIAACRVAANGEKTPFPVGDYGERGLYGKDGERTDDPAPDGRWPPNLALSHLPECERVGVRRVKTNMATSGESLDGQIFGYGNERGDQPRGHADPDGTETIPAYECAPGCPVAELDRQSGELKTPSPYVQQSEVIGIYGAEKQHDRLSTHHGDTGGASRFFYTAKASRAERNAGLDGLPMKARGEDVLQYHEGERRADPEVANFHPTVKPIDLMRWLVRLVTPPGGRILDPFLGSGTTGIAAHLEGFDFIGIEREAEYADIAEARIEWWSQFPAGTEVDAALGLSARETVVRESGQLGLLDGEAA
jgi:DNA modification methylase